MLEQIKYLYLETDLSKKEICEKLNIGSWTLTRILKENNIQRTEEQIKISHRNSQKRTCLKRYGNPNYNNTKKNRETKQKRHGDSNYNNRNKARQTCKDKYGDEYYNNREKAEQTYLERFGYTNNLFSEDTRNKIAETKLERYGNSHYTNREQAEETCSRNKVFVKSRLEEHIREILYECYDDVITQYRIANMIFDFKINETFIEINGAYFHNNRPFNGSKEHLEEFKMMKERGR